MNMCVININDFTHKKIQFKDLLEGTKQKTTKGTAKNIIKDSFYSLRRRKPESVVFEEFLTPL